MTEFKKCNIPIEYNTITLHFHGYSKDNILFYDTNKV